MKRKAEKIAAAAAEEEEVVAMRNNHGVSWWRGPMIGKGGFGSVFVARLKKKKKDHDQNSSNGYYPPVMAVKSAEFSASGSLQKEKQVFNNIQPTRCPYILNCFGEETTTDHETGMVYNVLLEYASGGTLSGLIKSSGSPGLPDRDIRYYTMCILRGIDCVHRSGYVHCDIKPENLFLVPGGKEGRFVVKIGDFGLAKKVEINPKRRKFDPFFGGTAMYMAPETVVDHVQEQASDIWALGCVVLKMITGKPAWGEEEGVQEKIRDRYVLPEIPPGVSKEAREFLKGCLVRNPMFRLTAEMLLSLPFVSGFNGEEVDSVELGDQLVSSELPNNDDGNEESSSDSYFSEGLNAYGSEEDESSSSFYWLDDCVDSGISERNGIIKDELQFRPQNRVLRA